MSTPPIPKEISERISRLRLPLILGVIVAHAGGDFLSQPAAVGWPAFILQLLSGVWSRNSVNLLYIFSGFLFFYSFLPTWEIYRRKLTRRFHSLLVPYLFWNLTNLLFLALIQTLPFTAPFFSGKNLPVAEYTLWDVADAFLGLGGTPIAYPFWFLRDLMLMVLCAPVFYNLAKRLPWLTAAALYLYWFLSPNTITILMPRSLVFFYLGALWAVQRPDIRWLDRWRTWVLVIFLLVSLLDAATQPQNRYLHHAAMTLGTAALWILAHWIGQWRRMSRLLDRWAPGAFFVFAVHEPTLVILRKLGYVILPPIDSWHILALYLLTIMLTTIGCLGAWRVTTRLAPRFTRVISGGR